MKQKILSIIYVVVVMFAVVFIQSCKKDNSDPQRFYATLQQYNGGKVYVDEPYSYWVEGDKVSLTGNQTGTVYYDQTNSRFYIQTSGRYTSGFGTGPNPYASNEIVAVYPKELLQINQINGGETVQIEMEPTQVYEEYQESGNVHHQILKAPMAAYLAPSEIGNSFGDNAPTFEFKNLCALLQVNIETTTEIKVTRIEVENTGANADPLWGDFQIAFPGGSTQLTQPVLRKLPQDEKYITKKLILNINHYGTDAVHLTGGDPISSTDNHPFYIYLPPVNYDDVHITVYIMDGTTEKCYTLQSRTGNSGTFQANTIYPVNIAYSQNNYPSDPDGWHVINTVNTIGEFTVDGQGHKVSFSRANVQGLDDDIATDYFFALHQYHYIGDASHNPFGIHDHFASGHEQLIVNHFYNDFSEHWRLLTVAELTYIMDSRTTSSGYHYCWSKVASVPGMVIFPDDYQQSYLPSGFPTTCIDNVAIDVLGEGQQVNTMNPLPNTPSIDVYTWYANFESKGCVFLPCLSMEGAQASSINLSCYYWLSNGLSSLQPGSTCSAWEQTGSILKAYVRLVKDLPSSK